MVYRTRDLAALEMQNPEVIMVFRIIVGTEACNWSYTVSSLRRALGFVVLYLVGKFFPALHHDQFSLMFKDNCKQKSFIVQ